MPQVYVIHENPNFNYAPAEEFGEVVFMTDNEFSGIANSLSDRHVVQDIRAAMEKFDTMQDFLVLTGSPIIIGFAMHLLLAKGRPVQLLKHDNRSNSYRRVIFTHHIL